MRMPRGVRQGRLLREQQENDAENAMNLRFVMDRASVVVLAMCVKVARALASMKSQISIASLFAP